MKHIFQNRYRALLLLCCFTAFLGCKKDDFLDVTNQASVSVDIAFGSESAADLVLNDIYNSLPDENNFNVDPFENWSDNSMSGYNWCPTATIVRFAATTINSSSDLNITWTSAGQWLYWNVLYTNIRKCNVFIMNAEAATALSQDYKTKRIAEARVIRAYFYHLIWMFYGGGPIITKPDERTKDGDAIFHPRATFDETFTFLETELTEAAAALKPNNGNDGGGRANQGTALTLKGWVELFYASPLRNTANDKARWAAAAATNKQVMSLGYSLYNDYGALFMTPAATANNEGIFYRQYLAVIKGSSLISYCGPTHIGATWNSWGGATPTQEMVDAYGMANGRSITDPASGYDPAHPYANREPRFYQSILFDGSTINGQEYQSRAGSAFTPIDLSDVNDQSNTGYSWKKRMDTAVNVFQQGASGQSYYYFRYAEVLLNYAEAQNEAAGPDASVYDAIDQLRTRAGIPKLSTVYPGLTQAQMREVIRTERRVELAFEDKRWWDLVRWKLAEVNLNKTMHGMLVKVVNGNLTYTVIEAARGSRTFSAAKNYVMPIPQFAIDQNPQLKGHQNPGY